MRQLSKKVMAVLLAMSMAMPIAQTSVYAAGAAEESTETVDDPVEVTQNAQVSFVVSSTKKVITLDGTVGSPIDCNVEFDKNNIPDNGIFKIYYGQGTTDVSKDKTVVNFTCDATKTSWKADNDNVYQMETRTNPAGWESVMMEPQGDGTVSFKSCANGKYFSIKDGKLVLVDDETATSNEKFIPYTDTKPKAAKKVKTQDVAGDNITVSWDSVDECVYTGYQVLYSTSEDGKYVIAGETASTSYTVSNLKLDTRYYFKIRTVTNNDGGKYADSAVVYTTTLKDYKPSTPQELSLKENKDGSMNIEWGETLNTKGYKIYKADSRFGDYREIADVNADKLSYTDKNPNDNKYENFYKVMAYNDSDKSSLSEATSIEIAMFGANTYIFSEKDDVASINDVTSRIFEKQHYQQFGEDRYTIAFKKGDYTNANLINVGYYTQILGLGKTPYDVQLNNVHAPCALSNNNATCNFWVGIENLMIKDLENNGDSWFNFRWSVSQAAPARRIYVERTAQFDWNYGWASGGYIADSYFEKQAGSYSQQQYYYRNCHINQGAYGVTWNNVIQGCTGVTKENTKDNSGKTLTYAKSLINGNGYTNWNQRGSTTVINETPQIREKPFLYFDDEENEYKVFVPSMRKNTAGVSWSYDNMGEGTSISVDKCFYVANTKDTAQTINRQLALGKNIIFSPGVYHVDEPIKVTRANTVLLGLGMASIIPENKETAIEVSDVGGVSVAGIILDAGNYSRTLLTIGEEGCNKDHSDNPVVLQDVIYRVGGAGHLGRTDSCLEINSNDVIVDHTWIWRADHGDNTGWDANTAKNGLVVNGDNVTTYGLFCEHFQEYDILWRGENGRTYFLQNEKCYDPQSQQGWMSHNGTKNGYAAYKVANNVKNHYAVGLGVYDVFINTNGASIYLDNAIEVPDEENVLIENACIVEIANADGPKVGINHIVNDTTAGIRTGAGSNGGYAIQRLLSYNNNESKSLEDNYKETDGATEKEEEGVAPTPDNKSEKDIEKQDKTKDNETLAWDMKDKDYEEVIEEQKKKVVDMSVTSQPAKLNYIIGQKLDLTGLEVKVTYLDETEETINIADFRGYGITLDIEDGKTLSDSDNGRTITVTYHEKTVKTNAITVRENTINKIVLKRQPSKLSYVEGEKLNLEGLEVTVTYETGDQVDVEYSRFSNYKITTDIAADTVLTLADDRKTIKVSCNGNTAETNAITVVKKTGQEVTTEGGSGNKGDTETTNNSGDKGNTETTGNSGDKGNAETTGNSGSKGNTETTNNSQNAGNSGNKNNSEIDKNANKLSGADNVKKAPVKAGTKFAVGKFTYKVTKVSGNKGTVILTGVQKKYVKKLKTVTVKATVNYNGYKFTLKEIGNKAFAKCKKVKKFTVKGNALKKMSKSSFNRKVAKHVKIKANKKVKKVVLKALKRKN